MSTGMQGHHPHTGAPRARTTQHARDMGHHGPRHIRWHAQDNKMMKQMLLRACAEKGIVADMHQLNATIELHWPAPVGGPDG